MFVTCFTQIIRKSLGVMIRFSHQLGFRDRGMHSKERKSPVWPCYLSRGVNSSQLNTVSMIYIYYIGKLCN